MADFLDRRRILHHISAAGLASLGSAPAWAQLIRPQPQSSEAGAPPRTSTPQDSVVIRPYGAIDEEAPEGDPNAIGLNGIKLRLFDKGRLYEGLMRTICRVTNLATDGKLSYAIEPQGNSVINIQDSGVFVNRYMFLATARDVKRMRSRTRHLGRDHPYQQIRVLAPLPDVYLHWLVRADTRLRQVLELNGHSLYAGEKETTSWRMAMDVLDTLGMQRRLKLVYSNDLPSGDPAFELRQRRLDVWALAGPIPYPDVAKMADNIALGLLDTPNSMYKPLTKWDPGLTAGLIAGRTYEFVDYDVTTLNEPIGIYTNVGLDFNTGYLFAKAYWAWRKGLVKPQPWLTTVRPEKINELGAPLHAGAAVHYKQAGMVNLLLEERPL